MLRPVVDDFLDQFPTISVHLILVARAVNLVEEGVDIALRLADLPDSSLIAVRVGAEVRRVVVASPRYLATHPRIREPADLAKHESVAFTDLGLVSWTFSPPKGLSIPRTAQFTPRLTVNSIRAAAASAIARMAAEASALG